MFFFFIITAVLSKEISLQTLITGNRSDITVHKLAYYVCNNMKCAILQAVQTALCFRASALCIELNQQGAHILQVWDISVFVIYYILRF